MTGLNDAVLSRGEISRLIRLEGSRERRSAHRIQCED